MIVVNSKEAAWIEANRLFPTDYEKDFASSERAGYDIYRHNSLNYYCRICDLGYRLEVLTGEYGEHVTDIWIVEPTISISFTVSELNIISTSLRLFKTGHDTNENEINAALQKINNIKYDKEDI